MQRALVVSRLATLGLALVLVALGAFAIWSGILTQSAGQQAQLAVLHSNLFQQARYGITLESAQEHAYAEELDAQRLVRFNQAVTLAHDALDAVLHTPDEDDSLVARDLLALNRRYVAGFRSLVAATQRGDLAHAAVIEATTLDPLVATMETRVESAAAAERRMATASLHTLSRTNAFVRTSTIVVFTLGLALLALFALILRRYRQRIQQAEVSHLLRAAWSDHLTGLGNHRAFQQALQYMVAPGAPLTLALLDLDDFKLVNDQHGHTHGDRVLTALGQVLQRHGLAEGAFRLGGDEFALLLPHASPAEAHATLTRLHEEARQHLYGVTLSMGLSSVGPEGRDAATLREEADAALYEAKRRGRDAIMAFTEIESTTQITSTAKILTVRRLLDERKIAVVFQPIWDLARGRILAFEALMRFSAEYGLEGPQEAFDIAEKIGRAHDLDAACREAILARAALLPPDALLFINVSPQTLDHGLLAGSALVEAVTTAGLAPERVVLELTERSMARLSVVVREARRLHGLGFKLALDDTGAGNAGLRMLSQLPVDFVKIDRGVVAQALTEKAARGILAGIVAIAQETGTYVIAEGIEDQAMLDLVRAAGGVSSTQPGIQGVQGYLLGRPSEVIPAPTALRAYGALLDAA